MHLLTPEKALLVNMRPDYGRADSSRAAAEFCAPPHGFPGQPGLLDNFSRDLQLHRAHFCSVLNCRRVKRSEIHDEPGTISAKNEQKSGFKPLGHLEISSSFEDCSSNKKNVARSRHSSSVSLPDDRMNSMRINGVKVLGMGARTAPCQQLLHVSPEAGNAGSESSEGCDCSRTNLVCFQDDSVVNVPKIPGRIVNRKMVSKMMHSRTCWELRWLVHVGRGCGGWMQRGWGT